MNTVLRIDFDQKVNMVGQHFEREEIRRQFSTDVSNNGLKPRVNAIDKDRTAILWAPDHVVFTGVYDVIV